MDPFIFMVATLVFVGAILVLPVFTCARRANAESGLTPMWQERCSGKIGALGMNFPAMRVALYQDFMVIGFVGQTVIPYRDLDEVKVKRGFFSTGVYLRRKGMSSGYHFNFRDSDGFVKLVEPHLTHH